MDLFSTAIASSGKDRQVLSVSELNRKAKSLLEIHFPLLWVEGEVSNLSCPRSGHWYFTLKDDQAQVRAAMFKGRNQLVKVLPSEGDKILARARVSLYEGRGEFQLIVEHMEPAGFGLLQKQFEELKHKLAAEGLFDQHHKKELPLFPQHLAIITSPTGAAVQDVISVLSRRFPCLPITIIPTSVQGENAPEELINAVTLADSANQFDVILLCRGGGSIEDLWAFNSERLARAIFHATTPIISAVGHETDFTLADFVADVRAPTPSAAGEIISPNSEELLSLLQSKLSRLSRAIKSTFNTHEQKIRHLQARLRSPEHKLSHWAQQLDQIDNRFMQAMNNRLDKLKFQLSHQQQRLERYSPQKKLDSVAQKLDLLQRALASAISTKIAAANHRLEKSAESLNIVSPLATLQRGYAIVKDAKGKIVRNQSSLNTGDKIQVTVAKGVFEAEITDTQV